MERPPLLRFSVNDCHFDMILIQGGHFLMGSDPATDPDFFEDEEPQHQVAISDFYLAQFPVSQGLWQVLMGRNPAYFPGLDRPHETVFWDDAQECIHKLRGITKQSFRLPTEAEWEYAARGGKFNLGCNYVGSKRLKEVAWYDQNSHEETKPLGRKFPNELGLYDMSGNVWEWCADDWHSNYEAAPVDGSAWIDAKGGSYRVNRGGGWFSNPRDCRSADRSYSYQVYRNDYLGFRLALSLQSVG
jgi:formylglycine-generating enzyme required for sulfatase activity